MRLTSSFPALTKIPHNQILKLKHWLVFVPGGRAAARMAEPPRRINLRAQQERTWRVFMVQHFDSSRSTPGALPQGQRLRHPNESTSQATTIMTFLCLVVLAAGFVDVAQALSSALCRCTIRSIESRRSASVIRHRRAGRDVVAAPARARGCVDACSVAR